MVTEVTHTQLNITLVQVHIKLRSDSQRGESRPSPIATEKQISQSECIKARLINTVRRHVAVWRRPPRRNAHKLITDTHTHTHSHILSISVLSTVNKRF